MTSSVIDTQAGGRSHLTGVSFSLIHPKQEKYFFSGGALVGLMDNVRLPSEWK